MQVFIELSALDQMVQPFEARKFLVDEIRMGQADRVERPVKLRGSLFSGPGKLKLGKGAGELAKIGLVRALIGANLPFQLELAARNGSGGDLGEIEDLVIQLIGASIESLVMNFFNRRLQYRHKSARHVLDMDHGTPRFTIAVDDDFACRNRRADQIV